MYRTGEKIEFKSKRQGDVVRAKIVKQLNNKLKIRILDTGHKLCGMEIGIDDSIIVGRIN